MVDRFTELDMITLFIFTGPEYNPNLSMADELYLSLFLVWFCVNLSQKSLHPLRLRHGSDKSVASGPWGSISPRLHKYNKGDIYKIFLVNLTNSHHR